MFFELFALKLGQKVVLYIVKYRVANVEFTLRYLGSELGKRDLVRCVGRVLVLLTEL